MEDISGLLFELSSSDRFDILMLVKKSPLKLSHISTKLNFTVQEASRNLARLSDAKLVTKDVEGVFHLTSYGEEALNMLQGFGVLLKNRDYFLTHTPSKLPMHFRASLGMLDNFRYVGDVMTVFHNAEKMIANAQEFVWIMTNQVLASTIPYLLQLLDRGGNFRLLMPKDYQPTDDMHNLIINPTFRKATRDKKLENNFIDKIDVFLCLSEREVGAIAFPTLNGKIDYLGFKSENQSAVEWGKTLYNYYWDESTSAIPSQLLNNASIGQK